MTINDQLQHPTDEANLSPVLAGMVAQLSMPAQYSRIIMDAELSIRQQCARSVHNIDK